MGDRATGQWQEATRFTAAGALEALTNLRRSPDQDRTHGEIDGEETTNSQLAGASTMYLD